MLNAPALDILLRNFLSKQMERPWQFEATETRTTKEQAEVQDAVLREFAQVESELGDDRWASFSPLSRSEFRVAHHPLCCVIPSSLVVLSEILIRVLPLRTASSCIAATTRSISWPAFGV